MEVLFLCTSVSTSLTPQAGDLEPQTKSKPGMSLLLLFDKKGTKTLEFKEIIMPFFFFWRLSGIVCMVIVGK